MTSLTTRSMLRLRNAINAQHTHRCSTTQGNCQLVLTVSKDINRSSSNDKYDRPKLRHRLILMCHGAVDKGISQEEYTVSPVFAALLFVAFVCSGCPGCCRGFEGFFLTLKPRCCLGMARCNRTTFVCRNGHHAAAADAYRTYRSVSIACLIAVKIVQKTNTQQAESKTTPFHSCMWKRVSCPPKANKSRAW